MECVSLLSMLTVVQHIFRKGNEWIEAIAETMKETTVHGDGIENLDSIAVSYVRLLRKNFRPASERNLFDKSDYNIQVRESGDTFVGLVEKPVDILREWPVYDRAMYKILSERIIKIGSQVERIERDLLLRS